MEVSATTPRRERTIAGIVIKVPAPYAAGHVVTEAEAGILNQTLAENISNNLRDKFTTAAVPATDTTPAVAATTLSVDAAQALVDAYIVEYTPGVRGAGGTSVRVIDPIEKEARLLAKARVDQVLKDNNLKRAEMENYPELVETAFQKRRDEYMAQGKSIVAAREKAAGKVAAAPEDNGDDLLGMVKAKAAPATDSPTGENTTPA